MAHLPQPAGQQFDASLEGLTRMNLGDSKQPYETLPPPPSYQKAPTIRRKPVASGKSAAPTSSSDSKPSSGLETSSTKIAKPGSDTTSFRHQDQYSQAILSGDTAIQNGPLRLDTAPTISPHPEIEGPDPFDDLELVQSPSSIEPSLATSTTEKSKFKTLYEEARHFAGGLITHPYESNKKFAILRHSHGLVYYNGPSTSVAITIFSTEPLPANRTIWMQRKGWSGQRGMKVRSAMGINGTWLNVTPDASAPASAVHAADERAWQRDIDKFTRKRPPPLRRHVLRETDIVRIPSDSLDGYFRLVLCAADSKKVLCPSPVFRVASTSTSAASLRGASLSTLPLELGIKLGSILATSGLQSAAAPLTSAAQATYQNNIPAAVRLAAPTALEMTGVPARIEEGNDAYALSRQETASTALTESSAGSSPLSPGVLEGPAPPYPLRLNSKIVPGTGLSTAHLSVPTANLASIPSDLAPRLGGVYFGWARISAPKLSKADVAAGIEPASHPLLDMWRPATIEVSPSPFLPPAVAQVKTARVHLIPAAPLLDVPSFAGYGINVWIMGCLRGAAKVGTGVPSIAQLSADAARTQAVLAGAGWAVEEAERGAAEELARKKSLAERYVAARAFSQRQVDRIPLHALGVRTDGGRLRDADVVSSGLCILR